MVAKQAASYLSGRLKTKVQVDKVDISFFKFIRIEEVYIEDLQQDTLFYIKNIDTEISKIRFEKDSILINLGIIQIDQPVYSLQQIKGDSFTNLSFILDAFASQDTTTSNVPILINSSNIIVTNGHFIWDNYNYEQEEFGINWDHINLTNINLDLTDFKMINDSFNGKIQHLSWFEKSGFQLDNLTGNVIFSSTRTAIENLNLVTPNSNVKANLDYEYDSIGSYVDFNNAVYMRYQIDSSIINFKDIAYFSPTLEGMDYEVKIFGKERGPVSDMKFQDIYLEYGEASVVYGRVFIKGLPDIESTSFTCRFKKISTNYADLETFKTYPFTSGETISVPPFIKNGKTMSFVGDFTGFYNDFVTYGTFKSKNGILNTDLQLSQDDHGVIRYKGQVATTNFKLGELTKLPKTLSMMSLDLRVEGKQLDFYEDLDLTLVGHLSKFDFMGYRYTDIDIDGAIKDQTITGVFDVVDPNLLLDFDGKISLKDETPLYEFRANIEHLRPKQLHLMDRDSSATLRTEVVFNFQGNSLDNILGRAGLRNFEFIENGEKVELKTVDFIGFTTGKDKTLSLTSDNINLLMTGEFYFQDLMQSMEYVTYKWFPSLYTTEQIKPKSVENFHLVLKANQFSGFSSIFVPQITFQNDLNIDLSFNSDSEQIEILTSSSHITAYGQDMLNLNLHAQLTADTFNLSLGMDEFLLTDSGSIENVQLSAIASKDLITTNIIWNNNEEIENSGNVHFDMNFTNPENFNVLFYESDLMVSDTLWQIKDSCLITKSFKEYSFKNVSVTQGLQRFSLEGFMSEDAEKVLDLEVIDFELKHLNPMLQEFNIHTTGIVNGTTQITDIYGDLQLRSNSTIKDLVFNHQKIGNGHVLSDWNADDQKFEVDIKFEDGSGESIELTGAYYPKEKLESLHLNLKLDDFPVKIIEPVVEEYIDDIKGTVSGNASINGTIKEPLLNGGFVLNKVQTHVIYLNEKLFVDSQAIFIRPNLLGADAIILRDEKQKRAQVNFSLFHHNYSDLNFDISITSLDLFRAFNTKKTDNKYFYGNITLNPGSTIGIESGLNGALNLTANVATGQGTKVIIPFYEDDEVAKKNYIYFKLEETNTGQTKLEQLQEKESKGLNLDMTMDLNKNAEVQLIFDEFTNDKIQARGVGNITLKINEEEDFSIFGNYEISEGFYLFTFSKVISKKFDISEGSRLTWNGDPLEGQADIKAVYKVRTTLAELGSSVTAAYDSTQLRRRIPVEVVLSMTGNYMDPDLFFAFKLPPIYDEIQSMLNNLDEGERNKQVFGLLILNKFMPITGGDASTGSSVVATNSTEVLSNQLSSWLSKISNDFDVGVRYNPGDNISADEVEVALSTQLFNDRVLIETNFGISGTVNSTSSSTKSNNFVGEGTISYKINKKGNIVGKVFNRSNELNPVNTNIAPYTQGIGIAYSEPFKNGDNLGCIMSNHFKKIENKRDCEAEYYQTQLDNKEENVAKIRKSVERSRKKQKKQDEKEARKRAKSAIKEHD